MHKQRLFLILLIGGLVGAVINSNPAVPLFQEIYVESLSKDVNVGESLQSQSSPLSQYEGGSPQSAVAPKKWTVMVYLDADNNLESAGIDDLNEMEFVGSTTDVDIVVQMDRISGYDYSNGDWTGTRRFHVERDTSQSDIGTEVAVLGEVNMGASNTLKNFIEWTQTNYPAENYALILWDHGSGVMWGPYNGGIAWDDTSNQDYLTLTEIQTAITNKSIDLLGFDACLMASAEFFYGLSSDASILVGSEKTEPGDGWPYDTILGWLTSNPTATASQLGDQIVDKYIASYSSTNPVTQSAVNASLLGAIYESTSILADALSASMGTLKSVLTSIRGAMYAYDDEPYVDLYDFAQRVYNGISDSTIQGYAQDVMNAITAAVINSGYHTSELAGSHGLTVYFPEIASGFSNSYRNGPWATSNWDEFLLTFYNSSSTDDQFENNDNISTATTIHSGYYPGLIWSDFDYYNISVLDGQSIYITMTYTHTTTCDLDLYLYDQTGNYVDYSEGITGTEEVYWAVFGGDQIITIFVDNYKTGTMKSYSLSIYIPVDDDIYEANDNWGQATDWSAFINLTEYDLVAVDPDYYALSILGTALVEVFVGYQAVDGILSLQILGAVDALTEPDLLYLVDSATDNASLFFSTDDWIEEHSWFDYAYSVYYFVVINYENNTNYSLEIRVDPGYDDSFDDGQYGNDYIDTATSLSDGTYLNLVCIDNDLFNVTLDQNEWLNFSIVFSDDQGDLDLYLYNELKDQVAQSYFWMDGEFIIFRAPTAGVYMVQVFPYEINLNYSIALKTDQIFATDTYDGTNNFEDQSATFPEIEIGTHYLGLTAWQQDFFKIYLTIGSTVNFHINYTNYETTLVLFLYEMGDLSNYLDYAFSSTEEYLYYEVSTSGYYVLNVFPIQPVAEYDLIVFYDTEPTLDFNSQLVSSLTVNLTEEVISTDGIESFAWDFGDGTYYIGLDANLSHVYSTPGEYTLTLYVFEYGDAYYYYVQQNILVYATPASFDIILAYGPDAEGQFIIGWNIGDNVEFIAIYVETSEITSIEGLDPVETYEGQGTTGITLDVDYSGTYYIVVYYENPLGNAVSNTLTVTVTGLPTRPPPAGPGIPGFPLEFIILITIVTVFGIVRWNRRR